MPESRATSQVIAEDKQMEDPEQGLRATSQRGHLQRLKTQRGWYLLEYAMVTFGLAVFIVGLADISRIFHARGAVRAGVTEGLRCLYPTEPGCIEQSLATGWFSGDRFTARITGDQTNRYELPRISIGLSSAWFNEPVSEAQFATKQLTAVTLTQPQDPYRQYQVLFPGVAHAVYLLKTQELPRVHPGTEEDDREAILNPRFFDPDTSAVRGANRDIDIPALSLNTAKVAPGVVGDRASRSFTIQMSDILPENVSWSNLKALEDSYGFTAACYQGARTIIPSGGQARGSQAIAWPQSGIPASCSYRGNPAPLYYGSGMAVPIMIHVEGTGYINPNGRWPEWQGVYGQIKLKLFQGGRELADLGGREFSRSGTSADAKFSAQWGSFVVRGAGYTDAENIDVSATYRQRCERAGYDECRKYITLPMARVGQPLELRFELQWRRGANAKASPNVGIIWQSGKAHIFHPSFTIAHEQRSCGYASTPNSCGVSVAPMQVSFKTTNLDQSLSHTQRAEAICDRKQPVGYQPSIPEALESIQNEIRVGARPLEPIAFWSNGSSADSCADKVSNVSCAEEPREYMKGCEPQYSLPTDAVRLCNLTDYQPTRDRLSDPRFQIGTATRVDTRGACTSEPFPECARNELVSRGTTFLGAASHGCALAQPVNATSEVRGPVFSNTCVDELAQFIKEYRIKHNVPDSIGINSLVTQSSPVITDVPPSNSCWKYDPIPDRPGQSWLCAEQASYAVANKCCEKYGAANCSLERVAVGDSGGSAGSFNQIIEGAKRRTLETVQAAYPPAKMDLTCGVTQDGEPSENDCIAIDVGSVDDGRQARVQAAMRVPLALFEWFGMADHTVVQYEETRTLESALVGDVS